jgi:hypothetical protein
MSETMQDLERAILESIHGMSYDELKKQGKENFGAMIDPFVESIIFDITLCRVLQALENLSNYQVSFSDLQHIVVRSDKDVDFIGWKLLNEDKSPATLEDQDENVIHILSHIFFNGL